jgi:hypothetical protein
MHFPVAFWKAATWKTYSEIQNDIKLDLEKLVVRIRSGVM